MSNPPCVSSTLSIASPIRPLSPHEDRGDKAPQQQKAAPSTPSTWRRKQAVLVLVFVVVPLLLMSDGSAKNNNEKHSNKPGLSVSRVEGHGDTTPPPTPIQRSSHPSDSSIRIQSQGTPKSTRPPPVEEFTQRTAKPTINRKPRKKSPSIRFAMFPKASHCNCRYEEQPDARRHTFKEALSKFMYGRNDTTSSSPTTSVQQRRVLVVGDSVGRYLAAGIVNGVIEEGALDRDVLESLNLAAEQTKMKGGVATNLRRTRGTIAQWPPPEMLAKMSPAVVDKLPFRLQFEMDIFVSQDRNFTATRNMFDPTHIILARGNWDLDKMTPSNPRRYYNEFQGLLVAVRRAFPETHMFVYGFHKLIPDTTALNKHPHVRCTHRAEVGMFRDANYCAVKRYNGLLPPRHRAVHYIDSFGITKGFRKSNQENKDGLHYIGAALAALAHSTVELMLGAQEQQVVGNPTSFVSMNTTEVQQCTIAVKDEFHTSRMPCQTPPSWLNETVQTAFELSQEAIFAGKHMHRIAANTSCGGAGKTGRNNHTSYLFPVGCPMITAEDINAVRTKRTLSPAIKAVSLAAGPCSKLLVWLKEQFSGVQHLQRLVADAKRSGNEDGLPWTLIMLSDPHRLQEWLRNNAGNIVFNQQRDGSGSSAPSPLHNFSFPSPIFNTKEFNSDSVIDVAAQCVTMLHTHVTPAYFHEVLWPLSYGSGMVPCGAVRFLPFFQEWLSTPSFGVNNGDGEDDTHATQYSSTVAASPHLDKSNTASPLLLVSSSPLTSLSSASSTTSVSSQRHTARLLPFTEIDQHCHPGSIAWHEKAFGAARNTAVAMLQQEQRQVLLRSKEQRKQVVPLSKEKSVIVFLEDDSASATIFLRHCPDLLQSVHESLLSNRTKAGLHPSSGPPFGYEGKSSRVFFSFHEALDQFPVSPLIEDLEEEVLGTSVKRCVAALTKIVKHPQQTILNNNRSTNSHTRVGDPPKTKGLCAQLKKLQGLVASLHPVFLPSVTAKDVARLSDEARCPT